MGIVVEVLPPVQNTGRSDTKWTRKQCGSRSRVHSVEGPGAWRDYHPAILASYCDDQEINLRTYKHENLAFEENPYVPGEQVILAFSATRLVGST